MGICLFTSVLSQLHSLSNVSAFTGPGRGSEDLQLHIYNHLCAGVCLQACRLWIPPLLQGQVVDVTLSKATSKVVDPKQIRILQQSHSHGGPPMHLSLSFFFFFCECTKVC